MKHIVLIIALTGILLPGHALAEDGWTFYTTENSGLASDYITCMAADDHGRMWFGHGEGKGVSVFDGENWTVMQPYSAGDRYQINDFAFAGDSVWAASDWGLFLYEGGVWETVFEDVNITAICADRKGGVWIGGRLSTHDAGRDAVSHFDGEGWTTWYVGNAPNAMAVDRNNRFWFVYGLTLYCYDGHEWGKYSDIEALQYPNAWIHAIREDENGVIWFLSRYGAVIYDGNGLRKTNLYGSDIAFTSDSEIVLTGNTPIRYDFNVPDTVHELLVPFSSVNLGHVEQDSEGSLWFETDQEGLARYSGDAGLITADYSYDFNVEAESEIAFQQNNPSQRQIGGWFPLAMGNTWKYHRTYKPLFTENTYEDTLVQTIIDAHDYDTVTEYEFLDGSCYFVNANGDITEAYRESDSGRSGLVIYEVRPCGEIDCDSNGIYNRYPTYRKTDTMSLSAGTFEGYSFSFGAIHGSGHFLVHSVGLSCWRLFTDIPEQESFELETAYVNGVMIGITDSVESDHTPAPLTLAAPFPNPFNASTTIRFTLPYEGETSLTAYSVTGQKVRTLLSGELAAGNYTVIWDAADDNGLTLSSGVYLLRLESGGMTATQRLAFVK